MRTATAPAIPSAGPDASLASHASGNSDIPKTPSNNGTANPVHAMVAGYMAGTSGTMVGYPLDSLKVWVQTNSLGKNKHLGDDGGGAKKTARPKRPKDASSAKNCEKARACSSKHGSSNWWHKKAPSGSSSRRSNSTKAVPFPASSSSVGATTKVQHRAAHLSRWIAKPLSRAYGTIRALYSGVTGPLVTVGMVQSVNFATYDATRRFLYRRRKQKELGRPPRDTDLDHPREYLTKDSLYCVAMSGSVGGMTTAVLTAPLLMIKIRQQITGNGFRTAVREIFFVEGPGSRLRFRPFRPYGAAFVPHAMSEAIGRMIYVTTYEGLKRTMVGSKKKAAGGGDVSGITVSSLSLRERMMCAAGSGILCWGTFFPLDALRNRMYDAATRTSANANANSILDTLRVMRAERAFYRGYSISMLRAGPVAAAVLPVYDTTLEKLSSWT